MYINSSKLLTIFYVEEIYRSWACEISHNHDVLGIYFVMFQWIMENTDDNFSWKWIIFNPKVLPESFLLSNKLGFTLVVFMWVASEWLPNAKAFTISPHKSYVKLSRKNWKEALIHFGNMKLRFFNSNKCSVHSIVHYTYLTFIKAD